MNKKRSNWWEDSAFTPSSEYQAVLDRATALGYTKPSPATQVKQNTLLVAMKNAGIFANLNLFYCFAANDSSLTNFSKLNWISPSTFELSVVSTPTYGVNGWTGNGIDAYLNTAWDPTSNGASIYVLNSASAFCYINDNVNEAKNAFGMGNVGSSRLCHFVPSSGGSATYSVNHTGLNTVANASSIGFYQVQRPDASNEKLWKDGAEINNTAVASNAISTQDMAILAWNANGSVTQFTTRTLGCFGIGASLAGNEAALYTAWNTYRTSL